MRSSEGPANEEMQQTKPAFFSDCAGFAADLQCSTGREDVGTHA